MIITWGLEEIGDSGARIQSEICCFWWITQLNDGSFMVAGGKSDHHIYHTNDLTIPTDDWPRITSFTANSICQLRSGIIILVGTDGVFYWSPSFTDLTNGRYTKLSNRFRLRCAVEDPDNGYILCVDYSNKIWFCSVGDVTQNSSLNPLTSKTTDGVYSINVLKPDYPRPRYALVGASDHYVYLVNNLYSSLDPTTLIIGSGPIDCIIELVEPFEFSN